MTRHFSLKAGNTKSHYIGEDHCTADRLEVYTKINETILNIQTKYISKLINQLYSDPSPYKERERLPLRTLVGKPSRLKEWVGLNVTWRHLGL